MPTHFKNGFSQSWLGERISMLLAIRQSVTVQSDMALFLNFGQDGNYTMLSARLDCLFWAGL